MARILIIDDEPYVRDTLRQLLEFEGYEIDSAQDGREGLSKVRENTYDLIITDIVMPEQDGLEVLMTLRRERPDAVVVAMSGGGQQGVMDYLPVAAGLGAIRTLSKPFQRAELLEVVRAALGFEGSVN